MIMIDIFTIVPTKIVITVRNNYLFEIVQNNTKLYQNYAGDYFVFDREASLTRS